jgi:hypothetical protein
MHLFKNISYLEHGNEKQRYAYKTMSQLGISKDLAQYNPVLCGTIPIGIHTDTSDLDVIMEVRDFKKFYIEVTTLYGHLDHFIIKEKNIKDVPTIKANFMYGGLSFELFGQPQAVDTQHAYQHMLVENYLLNKYPEVRQPIITLKEQGIKTEPAFAQVLELQGDPYDELIAIGVRLGILTK